MSRRTMVRAHGTRLGAGLAAFALAILLGTGTAIASAPYSVRLTVPGSVNKGARMIVKATGSARDRSRLTVFLDTGRCATSAAAESGHSQASRIINLSVAHGFAKSHTFTANVLGKQYACAYLNAPASRTRARASASFTVLGPSTTPPPPNVNACTLLSIADVTQVMGNGATAGAGTNPNGDDTTCNWYPTNPTNGNMQVESIYSTARPAGSAQGFASEYDENCGEGEPQQISGESYVGYYDSCAGFDGVYGQIGGTVIGVSWDSEGDSSATPPTESLLESEVSNMFGEVGQ